MILKNDNNDHIIPGTHSKKNARAAFKLIQFIRNYIFLFLVIGITPIQAQNQLIFPNLTGEQLRDSLVARYKTAVVLPYSQARDTMFAKIYAHDDSLSGVYSGYTIYLDPTQDPTTWAYDHDIDTEHTWPKSKGAVGLAESDMYHLYPTRREVNSARGNDPFAEIPDVEATQWFRLDQILYTMYQEQADSSDPDFFQIQKEVLYLWNSLDPVDSLERVRNELIAAYQGGHENPFILDTSLVRRAYFSVPVAINTSSRSPYGSYVLFQNYPNPFNPATTIQFSVPRTTRVTISIYNLRGQLMQERSMNVTAGIHSYEFNGEFYPSGIYFYKLSNSDGIRITRKLLLQK